MMSLTLSRRFEPNRGDANMVIDIYFFSNKETNSYIAAPLHNLLNYPGVGSSFSIIAV